MFVVAVYDIADARRLNKVMKLMEDFGTRVQRSVFECIIDEQQLIELRKKVELVIDINKDSVRFYRLCAACQELIIIHGRGSITADPACYIF